MKQLLIIFILALAAALAVGYYYNSPPPVSAKTVFQVKYGETVRQTAQRLKENHLIRNENFFIGLSYLSKRNFIKSGRYEIHQGMTSLEILKKMTSGDILTRRITIPEGFNLYQIAEKFEADEVTDAGMFLIYTFDEKFLNSLGIYAASAEGYLFPDTYVFPLDSDARDIIAHMYNRTRNILGSLRQEIPALTSSDVHKVLTMASLIEKEARVPDERRLISSVFHNRLQKNMRLDCDPTVRYAVKNFDGRLTYADLAADSPFNTYREKGLPPTPICSPGQDSIRAALRPARTKYLFFVARNDGSHYFSTTLKEHNRAVEFYQKGMRNGFKDRQKF